VFQVRIVFLYWLPCILRMQRPGENGSMEYPPTPTSDASERKAQNIQDVELRERYLVAKFCSLVACSEEFDAFVARFLAASMLPPDPHMTVPFQIVKIAARQCA
jgi:nicotinic acetylcholine receptor, invertebrate